ncbi:MULTISPECIES: hypothetical protein [Gloeobacter]|uniref:Uncharacterized protein n=1 Tax=Gloeobacter morelensis MG652769 TaxID=2781736 RepID=A0ABY3PLX8_9CYAN|nr:MULTISPECIES: hypothetical protein [Gloeobacter]UFP94402.1 hypothetical protein ISF26_22110 [Gloeobacter morelensis MG652769]
MKLWGKSEGTRISHFRRLQLENWKRQLDGRIVRAQQSGDKRLLTALQSEQQYLERCW